MVKYWKTKKFRDLQYLWYKKLETVDFQDHEKTVNGTPILTQRSSNAFRQENKTRREAKVRYFELLSQFVSEEVFENEAERTTMLRKAEGATIRRISLELKKQGLKSNRETVSFIIRRYEHKWKIREWLPHQMKRVRRRRVATT